MLAVTLPTPTVKIISPIFFFEEQIEINLLW